VILRIRFAKLGKVRFTSHRDVARIWERAVRKIALPVAYSQGFTPRARLSFGLALQTGAESLAEYLDVELTAPVDVDHCLTALGAALPDGIDAVSASIEPPGTDSLQQVVTSCSWEIDVPDVDPETVTAAVVRLLAADRVVVTRERKGKPVEDDLRPAVLALEVTGPTPTGTRLVAELGAQPRALRPAELLAALGLPGDGVRTRRTHQWIQLGDARWEPLPPAQLASSARAHACEPRREAADVRSRGQRPPDPGARADDDPVRRPGVSAIAAG
jgi:radical SAM-linked protein